MSHHICDHCESAPATLVCSDCFQGMWCSEQCHIAGLADHDEYDCFHPADYCDEEILEEVDHATKDPEEARQMLKEHIGEELVGRLTDKARRAGRRTRRRGQARRAKNKARRTKRKARRGKRRERATARDYRAAQRDTRQAKAQTDAQRRAIERTNVEKQRLQTAQDRQRDAEFRRDQALREEPLTVPAAHKIYFK